MESSPHCRAFARVKHFRGVGLGGNLGESFIAGILMEGEAAVAEGVIWEGRWGQESLRGFAEGGVAHGCHGLTLHHSGVHGGIRQVSVGTEPSWERLAGEGLFGMDATQEDLSLRCRGGHALGVERVVFFMFWAGADLNPVTKYQRTELAIDLDGEAGHEPGVIMVSHVTKVTWWQAGAPHDLPGEIIYSDQGLLGEGALVPDPSSGSRPVWMETGMVFKKEQMVRPIACLDLGLSQFGASEGENGICSGPAWDEGLSGRPTQRCQFGEQEGGDLQRYQQLFQWRAWTLASPQHEESAGRNKGGSFGQRGHALVLSSGMATSHHERSCHVAACQQLAEA
eukprot:scaffold57273_cov62-Attheya_sp.AAC.6